MARQVVGHEHTAHPPTVQHTPLSGKASPLRSTFVSTTGGVMTDEVGVITGVLELLTQPAHDHSAVEAMVRYAGAQDLYTVSGSSVRAVLEPPDHVDHRAAHGRILGTLTTPGRVEGGNEKPVDLLDD